MTKIVKFPGDERRVQCRRMAAQRKQLLRAFDRIESHERRAKAIETCVILGVQDRYEGHQPD